MALPKFLQPYLASYDLSRLDEEDFSVKKEVFSQVLNIGDLKAVRWLFNKYSKDDIKKAVENPKRGSWLPRSLNYWQIILGVNAKNGEQSLLKYS